MEDLLAVLDGDDATVRETRAVATAIHFVDDRRVEVAAAQEIGVQRVHQPPLDRSARRLQRLAEHLSAEHLRAADVATLAAEQVLLEPLELEQADQVGEQLVHPGRRSAQALTPSRFCMIGLVVVYCRCTFFAGFRCSAIAKAASAASWKPLRISFFLPG